MRKPLSPLQAFAEDARLAAERKSDVGDEMVTWLSIAQSADHLATIPGAQRERAIEMARELLVPFASRRPTMVHDVLPAPTAAVDTLMEQFRVAAEAMERAGCFELAFTTVSALCRLTSKENYVTSSLATLHLGRIARQMNDLSMAEDCYTTMLSVSTRERDGPLAARGHIGLALLHDMRGNLPASEKEYLLALELAAPLRGAYTSACQGLMSLAMNGNRLGDALIYGWKIYDASEHDVEARSAVLGDLAGVALRAGFPEAALRGYTSVINSVNLPRVRMISLAGALRASAHLGDASAVSRFDEALLSEVARANQPHTATMLLLYASEGWALVGNLEVARNRLASSREISKRYGFNEYLFRADSLEATLFKRMDESAKPSSSTQRAAATVTRNDPLVEFGIGRLEALAV